MSRRADWQQRGFGAIASAVFLLLAPRALLCAWRARLQDGRRRRAHARRHEPPGAGAEMVPAALAASPGVGLPKTKFAIDPKELKARAGQASVTATSTRRRLIQTDGPFVVDEIQLTEEQARPAIAWWPTSLPPPGRPSTGARHPGADDRLHRDDAEERRLGLKPAGRARNSPSSRSAMAASTAARKSAAARKDIT